MLKVAVCSTRPYKWAIIEYWPKLSRYILKQQSGHGSREGLSQESNALSGSNSSRAQMWTVARVSVKGNSQEPQGVYLVNNMAIEADWRDGPVVFVHVTRNHHCLRFRWLELDLPRCTPVCQVVDAHLEFSHSVADDSADDRMEKRVVSSAYVAGYTLSGRTSAASLT